MGAKSTFHTLEALSWSSRRICGGLGPSGPGLPNEDRKKYVEMDGWARV